MIPAQADLVVVNDLMDEATHAGWLPLGLAAKLFGRLGLPQSCFGKLQSRSQSVEGATVLP